jgi:hypothetical protein
MQLTILGSTADELGAQLERLVAKILQRLNYSRVHTNSVGAGGHEIDVRACYTIPSLSGTLDVPVICECKAHARPVDTPDWLKFLGKIYVEQATSSREVRGILIALTGVNGNVAGAYETLRVVKPGIELVTGEDLVRLIVAEFNLCTLECAVAYVQARTADTPVDVRLVFNEHPRWLIQFSDGSFIFIGGNQPASDPDGALISNALATLGVVRHRDLDAELQATRRALFAKKTLLAVALAEERTVTLDTIVQRQVLCPSNREPLEAADYAVAATSLIQNGFLAAEAENAWRFVCCDSLEFAIAVLTLLSEDHALAIPIGTRGYQRLIDERLLSYVLGIQGGISLGADDRANSLTLLRWSPTALAWALRPDPMLLNSRIDGKSTPELNANGARYFCLQLLQYAVGDFRKSALFEPYFTRLDLTELEVRRVARFKTRKEVALEVDLRERIGILRGAPDLGGGFVSVWLNTEAPEPWNWPTSVPPSEDSAAPAAPSERGIPEPNAD